MERLLIVGGGGHGRSLADAISSGGQYIVAGFLDDASSGGPTIDDWPLLGAIADLPRFRPQIDTAVVAIGNNAVRARIHAELRNAGFKLATIVHPSAIVSPRATLGEGTAVMAGAVVGTGAVLGEGVIVNCGAIVDHDCQIGDFAHLSVRAAMSGGTRLGRGAWMQAGSVLAYGADLPEGAIVAPGTAVSKV